VKLVGLGEVGRRLLRSRFFLQQNSENGFREFGEPKTFSAGNFSETGFPKLCCSKVSCRLQAAGNSSNSSKQKQVDRTNPFCEISSKLQQTLLQGA
jgi:hypothetical protein